MGGASVREIVESDGVAAADTHVRAVWGDA